MRHGFALVNCPPGPTLTPFPSYLGAEMQEFRNRLLVSYGSKVETNVKQEHGGWVSASTHVLSLALALALALTLTPILIPCTNPKTTFQGGDWRVWHALSSEVRLATLTLSLTLNLTLTLTLTLILTLTLALTRRRARRRCYGHVVL